jgi:hypothetical protein
MKSANNPIVLTVSHCFVTSNCRKVGVTFHPHSPISNQLLQVCPLGSVSVVRCVSACGAPGRVSQIGERADPQRQILIAAAKASFNFSASLRLKVSCRSNERSLRSRFCGSLKRPCSNRCPAKGNALLREIRRKASGRPPRRAPPLKHGHSGER